MGVASSDFNAQNFSSLFRPIFLLGAVVLLGVKSPVILAIACLAAVMLSFIPAHLRQGGRPYHAPAAQA